MTRLTRCSSITGVAAIVGFTVLPGCEREANCAAGCYPPLFVEGTFNVAELPSSGMVAEVCSNAECDVASTEEALAPGRRVFLSGADGLFIRLEAVSNRVVRLLGDGYLKVLDGAAVRLTLRDAQGGTVLIDYTTTAEVRRYMRCASRCGTAELCFEPSAPDSLDLTACEPGSTP